MEKLTCSVSGIQNKVGKTQLKNALNKIDGVNEVGVNRVTGTVQIAYNEPASSTQIKDCIENTGFKIEYS